MKVQTTSLEVCEIHLVPEQSVIGRLLMGEGEGAAEDEQRPDEEIT